MTNQGIEHARRAGAILAAAAQAGGGTGGGAHGEGAEFRAGIFEHGLIDSAIRAGEEAIDFGIEAAELFGD
ncbi:MAG: hypothetical protein ACE5HF_06430, partial [Gemmatimonadota bacterium]